MENDNLVFDSNDLGDCLSYYQGTEDVTHLQNAIHSNNDKIRKALKEIDSLIMWQETAQEYGNVYLLNRLIWLRKTLMQ